MAAQDIKQFQRAFFGALGTLGKSALTALYPRDFESYLCALELTTFEGDTIDFFSFPVIPQNISKNENEKTSIYPTLAGTTIINTDSFVPKDLTISGNFGRSFKIMIGNLGQQFIRFRGLNFSQNKGVYFSDETNAFLAKKIPDFNIAVKTGYGCIKIMQSIIDKAKSHDNGKPFRLYFYNATLGENYLVVPTKTPLTLSQSEAQNMIWGYTLNLSIIAPLDRIVFETGQVKKSLTKFLTQAAIQSSVNNVASTVTKYF
jgi:hypothetical protein